MNINAIIKKVYGATAKNYYRKSLNTTFTKNQRQYINFLLGKSNIPNKMGSTKLSKETKQALKMFKSGGKIPKDLNKILGNQNIKIPKRITKKTLKDLEDLIQKNAPDRSEYLLNQLFKFIDRYPFKYGTKLVVQFMSLLDMDDLAQALAQAEEEGAVFTEEYFQSSNQTEITGTFEYNTYIINKYLDMDFNTVNDMMYNEVNSDEV